MWLDANDGRKTFNIYWKGQVVNEIDERNRYTSYVYANGQKIARVSQADQVLHTSGTFTGSGNEIGWALTPPGGSGAYTVKTGDKLCFRQYTNNAIGGIGIFFSNGQSTAWRCSDTTGATLNQFSSQGAWAARCTDLTWNGTTTGTTITGMAALTDVNTGSGAWDIYYADMSIISANGTVTPFNLATAVGGWVQSGWNQNYDPATITDTMDGGPGGDAPSTHFYADDNLGTAQLEMSAGGYPTWLGQFAPFGQELDPYPTAAVSPFKFTGKERDTESGLDYFGARYYGSNMGRWMSPDWADKPEAVPYSSLDNPQSLNLHGYVLNNPLSKADPDGHEGCCDAIKDFISGFSGASTTA